MKNNETSKEKLKESTWISVSGAGGGAGLCWCCWCSKIVDLRGPMNRNDSVVCVKLPFPKMEVQEAAVFMETSQKMKSLLA